MSLRMVVFFALIVFVALPAAAGDPEGVFKIVFQSPEQEIEVVDTTGLNPIIVSDELGDAGDPQWSSDANRIVYSSVEFTFSDIYVVDPYGQKRMNLTGGGPTSSTDVSPRWSPDGNQILFLSNFDIYVMNADGSEPRNLTPETDIQYRFPVWSPSGAEIAYYSDGPGAEGLYVMDVVPPGETALPLLVAEVPGSASYVVGDVWLRPQWSPSAGSQIAYQYQTDIYVVAADGQTPTQKLTGSDTSDGDPQWSPAGDEISYSSYPIASTSAFTQIYTMTPTGSDVTAVTSNSLKAEVLHAWSSDGAQIVFSVRESPDPELYVIDANGTGEIPLGVPISKGYRPQFSPVPVPEPSAPLAFAAALVSLLALRKRRCSLA